MPQAQFYCKVFRNARSDEEIALAHEARNQLRMEELYAKAWEDIKKESKSRASSSNRNDTPGEGASSFGYSEEEIREKIASKLRECLPPPRDVTPVMKMRIAEGEASAMLTVWSSDRDTTEAFVEGSSIEIYNAFASGQR